MGPSKLHKSAIISWKPKPIWLIEHEDNEDPNCNQLACCFAPAPGAANVESFGRKAFHAKKFSDLELTSPNPISAILANWRHFGTKQGKQAAEKIGFAKNCLSTGQPAIGSPRNGRMVVAKMRAIW